MLFGTSSIWRDDLYLWQKKVWGWDSPTTSLFRVITAVSPCIKHTWVSSWNSGWEKFRIVPRNSSHFAVEVQAELHIWTSSEKNKASVKPSQFMSATYQHVVFSPGSRYHSLLPLCEHRREIKLHTLRVYALRHNDRQTDEGITGKTAESSVPITLANKPSVSQFTANFLIFPNCRRKENRTYLSTACWSSRDVSFA